MTLFRERSLPARSPHPEGSPPPCVCAPAHDTRTAQCVSVRARAQVVGFYFTDVWNIADTVNYTMLLLTLYSAG